MEPIGLRGWRNRRGKPIGGSGAKSRVGFGGDGVSPLFIMASIARLLLKSPGATVVLCKQLLFCNASDCPQPFPLNFSP
jgi:hypothetical protein